MSESEMLLCKVNLFLICLLPVRVEAKNVPTINNCVKFCSWNPAGGLLSLRIRYVSVVISVDNQSWHGDTFKVDLTLEVFYVCKKPVHTCRIDRSTLTLAHQCIKPLKPLRVRSSFLCLFLHFTIVECRHLFHHRLYDFCRALLGVPGSHSGKEG